MEETETVLFNNQIPLKVFKFRHEDTHFETWEKEYISDLIKTLKKGMTVYDIGAENGELTALVGKLVGGENVHIFEPNKDYFPNIIANFEMNELHEAASCFNGYVDEISSQEWFYDRFYNLDNGEIFHGCEHHNPKARPNQVVSIDEWCTVFVNPDVLLIDIEGAELSVVKGAKELIKNHSPIFYISIHKLEFILDRSNGTKEELIQIFLDNGYNAIHLSTDHEEHWKFIKNA